MLLVLGQGSQARILLPEESGSELPYGQEPAQRRADVLFAMLRDGTFYEPQPVRSG
ncbi:MULTISPECIES: hypothetical protein [Streptomyces]|uniref:hypothetical protein n=1 Tax=Streptomyces TaxID=1883 RepID=UPI001CE31C8D|nr:hypothetical protein OG872_00080 [Streptomyces althioticus]WTC27383.1 hypothetical protein OG872_33965 [Streptomyces althioticus]